MDNNTKKTNDSIIDAIRESVEVGDTSALTKVLKNTPDGEIEDLLLETLATNAINNSILSMLCLACATLLPSDLIFKLKFMLSDSPSSNTGIDAHRLLHAYFKHIIDFAKSNPYNMDDATLEAQISALVMAQRSAKSISEMGLDNIEMSVQDD